MSDKESGKCEYCGRQGLKRCGPEDGLRENLYACSSCWKILQGPQGPSLMRGHLSMELRGVVKPSAAKKMVSAFMEGTADWVGRPRSS